MARDYATRRYQLTINNPQEHGFDHNAIKAILAKGAKLEYWCMCDEKGQEETPHTHLYAVFKNPVMFESLKKKFSSAHIEIPVGTHSDNYVYVRKEGPKYNKDASGHYKYTDSTGKVHEGINYIDTFEEYGILPLDSRQGDRNDLRTLYNLISSGADNAQILSEHPEYMRDISHIDRTRQTLLEERKVIDCVGISRMPICTAATLIGKPIPPPAPQKEPVEILPEEKEPLEILTGDKIPASWIQDQKEVNVMALGEGYTMHDVAWIALKDGGYILPIPNVVYRISKPLPNGMVYLRKNKNCSKSAVPLQFVFDYVYQDLRQKHAKYQHIWDKKQRYKWDTQPITSQQLTLIRKLAPDYKIDTKKMTRGDASRVIQLLTYKPEEWAAQQSTEEKTNAEKST